MGDLFTKQMWSDRHDEIIADTKKFVKQIVSRYKAAYTYCIYQQLRRNLNGKSEQSLLLEQRKWQNYNRIIQSGSVYILGESDHRKWKRRYCVLQPNYVLQVYDSEEDFVAANRPRCEREYSNFDIVDNVDSHLSHLVKEYLRDFGFVRENVTHVIKKVGAAIDSSKRPTQHVLGLYHPYRGTFYMAVDSAVEKDKWLKSLQDAKRHLLEVQCETETQREAFEFAIRQTCDAEEHCNVTVRMAGTQEEITGDFITAYLSNGCKTMLQTKVKGDVLKKYKMWGSLSRTLSATVAEIVAEDYPGLRAKAEAEADELRQKILMSMPALNTAYETLSAEIVAGLEASFHDELELKILPKVADLVSKMGNSILVPLRGIKDIFVALAESVQHQIASTSTEFANNIDRYFLSHLDVAPRNPETMRNAFQAASGKTSPFGIFSETFPKAECSKQEAKLCVLLQKLLDSTICTFEVLCGEAVLKNDGHIHATDIAKIEARVLKKLSHDNAVLTKRFLTVATQDLVFQMLRSTAHHDSRNKLRNYEDFVPTELKAFLSVPGIFRHAVRGRLEDDLRPMLTAAFKRLTADHFNVSRHRSNSTTNSHSSDDTRSPSKRDSSATSSPNLVGVAAARGGDNQELNPETVSQPDYPEGDFGPGKSHSDRFDMDGETGECLEKVDENGEIVHEDSCPEEKTSGVEDLTLETSTADSSLPVKHDDDLKDSEPQDVEETSELGEVAVASSADLSVQNDDDNRTLNVETDPVESSVQHASSIEETGEPTDAAEQTPCLEDLKSSMDENGEPCHAHPEDSADIKEELCPPEEKNGDTLDDDTPESSAPETVVTSDGQPESQKREENEECENGDPCEIGEKVETSMEEGLSTGVDENGEPCHAHPEDFADPKDELCPPEEKNVDIPDDDAAGSLATEPAATSGGEPESPERKKNEDSCGIEKEESTKDSQQREKEDRHELNGDSGEIQELTPEDRVNDSQGNEEEHNRCPNGGIKQNGYLEVVQNSGGDCDPPVPVTRKSPSLSDSNEPQIEILALGNDGNDGTDDFHSQSCGAGDADVEKYNGVVEQIVQSGEEKLI